MNFCHLQKPLRICEYIGKEDQSLTVAENFAKIQERVFKVCDSVGRNPDDVTIMGVTKFIPKEQIIEAYNAGVRYFGESRVKEAAEKFAGLKKEFPGSQLHLIGSLQRNKAKQSLALFDCIQSVDRIALIEELVKQALLRQTCRENEFVKQTPSHILFELHTGEETKNGFPNLDELFRAAELALNSSCLKPLGLMTMAPFTADTALIRASFRRLVTARDELEKRFPSGNSALKNWDILSMGMSNDFEIAIEEGSNLLRIGSAIFKE